MHMPRRGFAVLIAVTVLTSAHPSQALTFLVDRSDDVSTATACDPLTPNDCSLRGAIIAANGRPDASIITVPAGTYTLSAPTSCTHVTNQFGTPMLTSPTLCIQKPMTIVGAGAATTIIDANLTGPVAVVGNFDPVEIRGVTLKRGLFSGGSLWGHGGAINNAGVLTVADAIVSDSTSSAGGGGIYNAHTLTVRNSRLERNVASQEGGAIFNAAFNVRTTVMVIDSTIADNAANNGAGGIGNFGGDVFVTGSTIRDNDAGNYAGGLWNMTNGSLLTVTDSTISGNESHFSYAGGVWNQIGTARFHSVTVANNHAGAGDDDGIGGGIVNGEGATFEIGNSIVAGNTATYGGMGLAPDCYDGGRASTVTSLGYNLIGIVDEECTLSGTTTGNVTNVAAKLGALAANGGPTATHVPQADSPAVDAGDPAGCTDDAGAPLETDQRGAPRVLDGDVDGTARCDIGAVERALGLAVARVLPDRVGNVGSALLTVSGNGFDLDATVLLRRAGQPDLAATDVTVDPGGSALVARFTLGGQATGSWDVVVTNPDTTTKTLADAVTVEAPRAPELWIRVVGPTAVRIGVPARFLLAYGNRGNVDAFDVPIAIGVPLDFGFTVGPVTPPPAQPGQVAVDWAQVPLNVVETTTPDRRIVPLVLPMIPAGSTGVVPFFLTAPGNHGATFTIDVKVGTPYYDGQTLDPVVPIALVEAARDYLAAIGIDASSVPDAPLVAYATTQLQTLEADGAAALQADLGGATQLYALQHLLVDVAAYAATQVGAPSTLAARVARGGGAGGGGFPPSPPPADCTVLHKQGGVLLEGQSFGSPGGGGPPPSCRFHPPGDDRFPGGAIDPNAKYGPAGSGASHFVRSDDPLSYTITFENQPSATLPAQQVVITDQLDATKVDLATFALGPVAFGDVYVPVPAGVTTFTHDVDLRPEQNLLVRVEAGLDGASGVVTWRLSALDPETEQPPEDPAAGFLPPNVTPPEGDGMVAFTISPLASVGTGTTIANTARIVFDANAPIDTDAWSNTIDATPPITHVDAATAGACRVQVAWSSSDVGAGVESQTLLVSENGGPLLPRIVDTTDAGATVAGTLGVTYGFATVGRDLVGNVEATPNTPQQTATVTDCGPFDLAVTKVSAPKKVTLTTKAPTAHKLVKVTVQNRGTKPITVPDLQTLAKVVTVQLASSGACPAPVAALHAGKPQKSLPVTLKPKASITVVFDLTLACANDPAKDAGHEDYTVTAIAHQEQLLGEDAHPADDVCPRLATGVDAFPNGKMKDKGCGGKGGAGAPVRIDVVVK